VSLLEALRTAVMSLLSNKTRSLLTMLGVIIGVAAVLVVVAIGEGLTADTLNRIKSMGSNMLYVSPGAGRRWGPTTRPGRLTDDDWEALKAHVKGVAAMAPTVNGNATAKYRNLNHATRVVGSTPEWPTVSNFEIVHGRFFTAGEERARSRVAVLGSNVVDELFYGRPLIGEIIRVKGIPFQVIGILEEKGGGWGNPDDQIIVPLSTARQRLFGRGDLSSIQISAASTEQVPEVMEAINRVLRRQHRIRGEEDDFRIRDQTEIIQTMTETGSTLTKFLGGIALIALLVGGVGIMNIMLVSVAERTREIGIRKAVGAKRRDILAQFLIESTTLSVTGGLIGIAIGLSVSSLLGNTLGWQTIVPPGAVLISFAFAAVVGVFFGYYPARKAALLDPIDCLRYE